MLSVYSIFIIKYMGTGVRAFLAARQHMAAIITLVELMLPTQLPCFKETTILNLRNRYHGSCLSPVFLLIIHMDFTSFHSSPVLSFSGF